MVFSESRRLGWSMERAWYAGWYLLVCAFFVVHTLTFIESSSVSLPDGTRRFCLVDDAMISMRYAWNLSHGHGLVWNVGEHVEGYSNPAWVLVMAAVTRFADKSTSCLVVQILGALLALASAVLAASIANQLPSRAVSEHSAARRLVPAVVFAATLTYYPLVFWSLFGMETGLLTVLLLSAARLALRQRPPLGAVSSLLAIAYLTRADAILVSGVLIGYLGARELVRGARAERLRRLATLTAPLATVMLTHLTFRQFYYGELLPNTYLLRLADYPLAERLLNGLTFAAPFAKQSLIAYLLCLGAAFVWRCPRSFLLFGLGFVSALYQVYVGGDPWPFWRLATPGVPLVLAAGLAGSIHAVEGWLVRLVSRRRANARIARCALGLAVAGATLSVVASLNWQFRSRWVGTSDPTAGWSRRNVWTADFLSDAIRPGGRIGVVWAGTIPYYSGLAAIDFLGRSDKHVARVPADFSGAVSWSGMTSVPAHNKYDLDYSIKELQPDYIEVYAWGQQSVYPWVVKHYVGIAGPNLRGYLKWNSPHVDWNVVRRRARLVRLPPEGDG